MQPRRLMRRLLRRLWRHGRNEPLPTPTSNIQRAQTLVSFAGISLKVPDVLDDPRWCGKLMPPLHRAAKVGDVSELLRLLEEQESTTAFINVRDGGETALHLAAEEGHVDALRLLLEHGAAVSAQSSEGWTALHCAGQSESAEAVALLIAHGADLHAKTRIGATPLHMAAFNGRLGATKTLIVRGADVHARDVDGYTPLADAKQKLRSCPCSSEEERERRWGAVIALLERVMQMADEERAAFARRSWGLLVSAALQDAVLQCSTGGEGGGEGEDGGLCELSRMLACYRG
mmetsp:Transcript_2205/g.4956  ORF Transcript_2205/g.4956 Transcript_2205/m.4956 type:complete len:289 (-) Transcript_2205:400-1266(-)